MAMVQLQEFNTICFPDTDVISVAALETLAEIADGRIIPSIESLLLNGVMAPEFAGILELALSLRWVHRGRGEAVMEAVKLKNLEGLQILLGPRGRYFTTYFSSHRKDQGIHTALNHNYETKAS